MLLFVNVILKVNSAITCGGTNYLFTYVNGMTQSYCLDSKLMQSNLAAREAQLKEWTGS